jgi:hypothetical protein
MDLRGIPVKAKTILASLALAALVAGAAGCLNPFRPLVGTGVAVAESAPRPTTPKAALELLRWCWVNRSIAEYEELFTDDFRFAFTDAEAANYAPVLRFDELEIARHLLVDGSATEPRVKRVDLTFSSSLVAIPDQRPGKIAPWHKQITTGVVLRVDLGESIWDVQGDVTFYLVRADSALIPQDLKDRGFGPKDQRWYIERWEDHTDATQGSGTAVARPQDPPLGRRVLTLAAAPGGAAGTQSGLPEIHGSWGALKQQYR